MQNKFLKLLICFLLVSLFFLGGIGNFYLVEIIGLVTFTILLLIVFNTKTDFKFPPGIILFVIFISLQLISFIWSVNIFNSIEYVLLFLSSLGLWVFFYNAPKFYFEFLKKIIPILAISFFILFFFTNVYKVPIFTKLIPDNCCTLYAPYTSEHNHLGDFWGIALIIFVYEFIKNKSLFYLLNIITSLAILIISQSRSALMGILTSLYVLKEKNLISLEKKKYIKYLVFLIFFIFILVSLGKVTIFSRPYYIQAVISLFKKPLGVGMGNFKEISINAGLNNPLFSGMTAKAHNIFFEVTSGIGIFSVIFFVWFLKIFKDILKSFAGERAIFTIAFIYLTVNFFFDMSYAIPTMLWLWFSFLGISQSKNK